MDPKAIGERLRAYRGERTMAEIAEKVGVSTQAYSNYESGIRIPRDETKRRLARLFNVSIDDLFF